MENRRQIGHHILNASSNLLGISFIVITSLRAFHVADATLVDEITSVSAILFLFSTIFSYLSLRNTTAMAERYEQVADVVFILGILSLTISAMLLTFGIIQ